MPPSWPCSTLHPDHPEPPEDKRGARQLTRRGLRHGVYPPDVGYDLHLTRALDWLDSEEDPLSLDDWVTFASASSALTRTDEITFRELPVFLLGTDPRTDPALYWQGGQVTVRGADEPHVPLLVAEAAKLGVRLVGDDHEVYE